MMYRRPVQQATRNRANSNDRRGAVLAAVMVGLAVAMTLLATMAKNAFLSREYLRLHIYQHQANWLCDAGVSRAIATHRRNPDYEGESWAVEDVNARHSATVTISLEAKGGSTLLHVVAAYPADSPNAIRCTRTVELEPAESNQRTTEPRSSL